MRTTLKTKNGGLWARLTALMVVLLMTTAHGKLMAQTEISTEEGLRALLQSGGTGSLTTNITATSGLSVAKSVTVTLNGNGHVLSVPVTGADEIGVLNDNASEFTLLDNSGNLTINNLTLRGGKETCVINKYGASLKMVGCTIERSGSGASRGGGLWNKYKCYLKNCKISRNNAMYGGGFLNDGDEAYYYHSDYAILVMDGCSTNENRNIFDGDYGGGACQSNTCAYLIVNNCTFADNTSTEIGGGINQYEAKTYILNSTFVGNISDNSYLSACGGGIGMNNGSLYMVNSLIMNNYDKENGSFADCDLGLYRGTPNLFKYSCYGTVRSYFDGVVAPPTPSGWTDSKHAETTGVFSSYRSSAILKPDGTLGDYLFNRPVIYQCSNGTYTAPIKAESTPTTGGVATYLYVPDNVSTFSISTIKLGYGATPTKIGDFEVAASTNKVTTYQDGSTRVDGVMGSSPIDGTEYVTLTLAKCDNGTCSGNGSLYGDSYPKGTQVSVTATPNAGFMFSGWKVNGSTEVSVTENPYKFNINSNTKLEAVFVHPVCKNINTNVEYSTVQQAIKALTEAGQTIQLISNVSLTEELSIQYNKNFTLDLNGYALKQTASNARVISNNGTLTINDSRYGQDAATHYLAKDGNTYSLSDTQTDYVVKGGVITGGNNDQLAGGIYNSGILTLNAGIICGNTTGSSYGYAGGLRNMGTFTMTGGEICYNYTEGIGGGLTADSKYVTTVSGGRIHHNTAGSGGGVFVFGGKNMTMTGGEVSGNAASNYGGIANNGNTTVGGTAKVTGNTATSFAPNIGIAMEDATLKISTETPLAPDAMFGVTKGTQYYYEIIGGKLTTNGTADDAKYFTSDNDSYVVAYNSAGYLELVTPVCKNTTTNVKYATVQQAVNALTETGQTIQLISNDTLTEKIEIASNKNFTLDLNGYVLKQNNAKACVIDNGGTLTINDHSTTAKHYYTVNADGLWVWDDNNTAGAVNFENLTERPAENSVVCIKGGAITGGMTGVLNAPQSMKGNTNTLSIKGGTICGNTAECGGGISNYQSCTVTIEGGTICGNTAQDLGGGIYNDGNLTISGGTISGNTAQEEGGGIYNCEDRTMTINDGIISGNTAQKYGGGIINVGKLTINGGTISGNTAPIAGGILCSHDITVSGNVKINGNTLSTGKTDSNLCLTTGVLYEIFGQISPIVTIGTLESGANIGVSIYDVNLLNGIISNTVGVFAKNASQTDMSYFTADDKRTYVEFVSESNKLRLSHTPETIYVTNNSDYKTKEAPIEASLRHAITNALEGDTVKFNLAESDRKILIKEGYMVTKPINIDGGSGITIDGGKESYDFAMGLYCNATLKNITFQNVNSQAGCVGIGYSDAVLTNCVFKDNTVSNANDGGGALNIGDSKVTINNSLFAGNSSQLNGGAITAHTMSNYTDVTLNNCTFTANSVGTGYDGSAIYASTLKNKGSSRASALLGEDKISSKFAGLVKDVKVINAKAHRGGEMSCNVTLNNTIVVGNTGGKTEIYSEKECTVTANNVLGTPSNWSGVTATGTIEYNSEKQLFVDAENGDYHIIPKSQAVDAGDNSKVPASLTTDLEGNNRIVNDIVDLGCYETPIQEVAINIYDNPMGYGEVKIKDNTTGNYLDEEERQHIKIGTSVTIEATPSGDYAFQGWFHKGTNNYFSKTQKFTFEATEDLELEARFTDSVIWIRVKKGN